VKHLILPLAFFLFTAQVKPQGCVAIRNIAGISPDIQFENLQSNDRYIFNLTNRYFEAPKTYRGDKFITDTLVRNKLFTLNLSLLRILNKGWALGLSIPVSANTRRNSSDHGGPQTPKHTTRAFGLGDIRFTAYKWLLAPSAGRRGNIQVGIGIKFPTGDYRYSDYFFRNDSTKVLAPVDQAIQLGDGGTGITAELGTFYAISSLMNVFANGYYLINPRDQNGVSNLKGRNAAAAEIANNTSVMSVPDQYSLRGGATFSMKQIIFTTALRFEKVPVKDLIGENNGFRRAASISSVEPGLTYKMKNSLAFIYVGIPFKRNIKQNAENNMTPAGFANYLFYLGTQLKL
jgi:hypothetical protein